MNNHRKPRSFRAVVGAGAVLTLTLSGCGFITGQGSNEGSASECKDAELRIATIRADNDPTTLAAQAFADNISQATDGKVKASVFPNSQLGKANDIFADLAAGENVDVFYEGISLYPTLKGASPFTVVSVPFLWDSYDQMRKVLKSDKYQELFEEAAEATGVRVVATAGDAEPRALSANRSIPTAAEMQGLKLRIADAPMPQAFAKALGAQPQVVAFADLYLALRQGVVDGQENGAITMVNQSLMEVQSHYMPTDYIRDVRSWYFSDTVWNSLCAEQQDAVREQAEKAGEVATEETAKQMKTAMETLEEKVEVVDVDVESFRTALEGVFEEFDGETWPEGLLEETRKLAAENK